MQYVKARQLQQIRLWQTASGNDHLTATIAVPRPTGHQQTSCLRRSVCDNLWAKEHRRKN